MNNGCRSRLPGSAILPKSNKSSLEYLPFAVSCAGANWETEEGWGSLTELLSRLSIAGRADAWLLKGVVDDRRRMAVPLERPSLRSLHEGHMLLEMACARRAESARATLMVREGLDRRAMCRARAAMEDGLERLGEVGGGRSGRPAQQQHAE